MLCRFLKIITINHKSWVKYEIKYDLYKISAKNKKNPNLGLLRFKKTRFFSKPFSSPGLVESEAPVWATRGTITYLLKACSKLYQSAFWSAISFCRQMYCGQVNFRLFSIFCTCSMRIQSEIPWCPLLVNLMREICSLFVPVSWKIATSRLPHTFYFIPSTMLLRHHHWCQSINKFILRYTCRIFVCIEL